MKRILILDQNDLCPPNIYKALTDLSLSDFSVPFEVMAHQDTIYYLSPSDAVLVLKDRTKHKGSVVYGELAANLRIVMEPKADRRDLVRKHVLEYIMEYPMCKREDIVKQFGLHPNVFIGVIDDLNRHHNVVSNGHGQFWVKE